MRSRGCRWPSGCRWASSAVISPFNVPLILSIRSVAPALALGNAVLLKPDPRTVMTGGVNIVRVFEEAGLPAGVLQLVPGGADVGEAIVTDPHVRVISFTGSTAAGRAVGELAGRHLKRAHLELGGNSAMLVLDDADVEKAVNLAAWGSFFHQGQICMTTGRHLVARARLRRLRRGARREGLHLPVGNPATEEVALGPVIDEGQRDKIHGLVTASTDAGARAASRGVVRRAVLPAHGARRGHPRPPRLHRGDLRAGRAGHPRLQRRRGGRARAARASTACRWASSPRDVMRGLALADRIPTGIVHINDQTVNDEANAPFGGVAASGTGSRFGGAVGQHRGLHRDPLDHGPRRASDSTPSDPGRPSRTRWAYARAREAMGGTRRAVRLSWGGCWSWCCGSPSDRGRWSSGCSRCSSRPYDERPDRAIRGGSPALVVVAALVTAVGARRARRPAADPARARVRWSRRPTSATPPRPRPIAFEVPQHP